MPLTDLMFGSDASARLEKMLIYRGITVWFHWLPVIYVGGLDSESPFIDVNSCEMPKDRDFRNAFSDAYIKRSTTTNGQMFTFWAKDPGEVPNWDILNFVSCTSATTTKTGWLRWPQQRQEEELSRTERPTTLLLRPGLVGHRVERARPTNDPSFSSDGSKK
ncbi:hypothetical protein CSHISOI_00648 [Colletotrichum shisoi]|uniref:Uncharacterized protein n=1 Tax=Colletotrichum shisoi TaxID=2078593 RepID=A0A5Q4C8D9_9PEZI|nr:hypothetical protein CSHISOI_00648 [Colletotrichum shisoi]